MQTITRRYGVGSVPSAEQWYRNSSTTPNSVKQSRRTTGWFLTAAAAGTAALVAVAAPNTPFDEKAEARALAAAGATKVDAVSRIDCTEESDVAYTALNARDAVALGHSATAVVVYGEGAFEDPTDVVVVTIDGATATAASHDITETVDANDGLQLAWNSGLGSRVEVGFDRSGTEQVVGVSCGDVYPDGAGLVHGAQLANR